MYLYRRGFMFNGYLQEKWVFLASVMNIMSYSIYFVNVVQLYHQPCEQISLNSYAVWIMLNLLAVGMFTSSTHIFICTPGSPPNLLLLFLVKFCEISSQNILQFVLRVKNIYNVLFFYFCNEFRYCFDIRDLPMFSSPIIVNIFGCFFCRFFTINVLIMFVSL